MPTIPQIQAENEQEAVRIAGREIADRLMAVKDSNILFLFSGGSSLKVLDHIRSEAFGPHVTVMPLDDRFTRDPARSNFLQFAKTHCYSVAKSSGCRFITGVPEDGEDLERVAQRLDRAVKSWIWDHAGGKIIAVIGMGPDGHTAGIMPYQNEPEMFAKLFVDTEKYFLGYNAEHRSPMPELLTASVPFFAKIHGAVFFACGELKKRALNLALAEGTALHDLPAAVINRVKNVVLVTDIKS